MDVNDLRAKIAESRKNGCKPFFVNATAGTTVLAAFDPLDQIAQVCQEEDLWFHVDVSMIFPNQRKNFLFFFHVKTVFNSQACLGGTLLLSEKYRDRLKGVEK